MFNGQRSMVNGQWSMINDQWSTVNYRANRTQSSVLELLRCSRYSRQSRNGQWSTVNVCKAASSSRMSGRFFSSGANTKPSATIILPF